MVTNMVVSLENSSRFTSKKRKNGDIKEDKASKKVKKADKGEKKENKKHATACIQDLVVAEKQSQQPVLGAGSFEHFSLSSSALVALGKRNIDKLFKIQYCTFEFIIQGKDVVGRAPTGTGKTMAFTLPIVERLFLRSARKLGLPRLEVLCLAPTRELALQIYKEFEHFQSNTYKAICVYGGVNEYPQIQELKAGRHVCVGTPGRILDFLDRKLLKVGGLQAVILDEADKMLELGFREDIEKILSHIYEEKPVTDSTKKIQFLLFSATLPSWVNQIINTYLSPERVLIDVVDPEKSSVTLPAEASAVQEKKTSNIQHIAVLCPFHERAKVLEDLYNLYCTSRDSRMIVFVETKAQANNLCVVANSAYRCQAIHGDIVQNQREQTLKAFREGKFPWLIATEVAARGIDIPAVEIVAQLDLPRNIDTYVHRAGRTGRANATGFSIVFYNYSNLPFIQAIENKQRLKFQKVGPPQVEDLIGKAVNEAAARITSLKVPPSLETILMKKVAGLLADKTSEELIVRMMLCLCNAENLMREERSLLSSRPGFKTYILTFQNKKIERCSYVWQILKGSLSDPQLVDQVSGMLPLSDFSGVAFDVALSVRDKFVKEFEKMKEKGFSGILTEAKTLPDVRPPSGVQTSNCGEYNDQYRFARKGAGSSDGSRQSQTFKKNFNSSGSSFGGSRWGQQNRNSYPSRSFGSRGKK